MRNPIKRALVRMRRPPFEGRWTSQFATPYEMLTEAHERMQQEPRKHRR